MNIQSHFSMERNQSLAWLRNLPNVPQVVGQVTESTRSDYRVSAVDE